MRHQLLRILAVFVVVGVVSCSDDEEPIRDAGIDAKTPDAICGNGKAEGDELCDGTDLRGETCSSVGDGMYTEGTLSCTRTCTFNLSKCTGGDSGLEGMDGGGGGTGG